MQVDFAQATDPGLDPHKRINEDAAGCADTPVGRLFVVCDGMGGHAGGKEAAQLALKTILDTVNAAAPADPPVRALKAAIELAGRKVFELGGPVNNPQRPGSTCVALLLHGGYLEVAHVGDSRAYAIRAKQIVRLTRDHSMVQEMVDSGVLSEQQAMGHPDANKITRALGMAPTAEVETRDEPMELFDGDVLLACCDGLTDVVRDQDILVTAAAYLKSNLQTACNELVALANRRGGPDNITVQIVRVLRAGVKASQTRVEEPDLSRPPPKTLAQAPIARTDPGAPASPWSEPQSPATRLQEPFAPSDAGGPPLVAPPPPAGVPIGVPMWIVAIMAAIIGLLAAALLWALKFR